MSLELESSSLTDSLADALRRQIIAGEIRPGEKLSELWVANRFAVARPTAKAAVGRLTNEGILRRGPRRSAVVPLLSAEDISDLYFSREPIEVSAVSGLASQREVPVAAERALVLMRVAAEQNNHADHTEADVSMHRALVAAVGSVRLRRMHETVMGEAQLCIAQVRAKADVDLMALTQRHAAILDAIRTGGAELAVDALLRDLHSCRDTLLGKVAALPVRGPAFSGLANLRLSYVVAFISRHSPIAHCPLVPGHLGPVEGRCPVSVRALQARQFGRAVRQLRDAP